MPTRLPVRFAEIAEAARGLLRLRIGRRAALQRVGVRRARGDGGRGPVDIASGADVSHHLAGRV